MIEYLLLKKKMFDWLFVLEYIIIIKINVLSYSNEMNWLYIL